MSMAPVPRPGIMDIAPYIGGEARAEGVERVIRLAANEGALGPSPEAVAAYSRLAPEIHRYPDGGSVALRRALGAHHAIPCENIVCGTGSDELIALLARAYAGPGDEVLYSRHGFLMYPIAAQSAGATPVVAAERDLRTDISALLEQVTPRTRLVFVANPNNPTGTYVTGAELRSLHAGLPPTTVLAIDAAYAEFVDREDYECGAALVRGARNVVMLRTFSKIHALAGLRLGWAYCSAEIADVLNRVRGAFNVNVAAQAAGMAALKDVPWFERSRAHNLEWLPWLKRSLAGLGLPVTDSVGNFVLARFPDDPARNAAAAFASLKSRGILTRKMGAYGLPEHLRITIGKEEDMRAVAAALDTFLNRPDV